jgi:hypothetical protein
VAEWCVNLYITSTFGLSFGDFQDFRRPTAPFAISARNREPPILSGFPGHLVVAARPFRCCLSNEEDCSLVTWLQAFSGVRFCLLNPPVPAVGRFAQRARVSKSRNAVKA